MATRINVTKVPFNYYWPHASAVTCIRELGPALVKDEVAVAAITKGYAEPFDPVTKPATRRRKPATRKVDAAADTGQPAGVDRTDLAPNDSADGVAPVVDAG